MSSAKPRSLPALVKLALTGALAGGLLSVGGCHWLLWESHEDEALEWCDEEYDS